MNTSTRGFVASLFATVILNAQVLSAQAIESECVAIARIGLMDEQHTKTYFEKVYRFFLRVRSEKNMTADKAKALAADAKFPIEGIPVEGGFSWSDESFKHVRTLDESELRTFLREKLVIDKYENTANPAVAKLVSECLNVPGVRAWAEFDPYESAIPTLVLFSRKSYVPPSYPGARVQVSYAAGIRCGNSRATTITLAAGERRALLCQRTPPLETPVLATINSSNEQVLAGSNTVWFPPVPRPKVEACNPIPDHDIEFAGSKHELRSFSAGPYCEPATVTVSGYALARRNSGGVEAYSEIRILDGSEVKAPILCSMRRDLPGNDILDARVDNCGPYAVPLRTRRPFAVQIVDGLADTWAVRMTLKVKPVQ